MIFNLDTQQSLAEHPVTALSFWMRARGMIGRLFTPEMDAMIFPRCNAVHTFFMAMPLDLLFLDSERRVAKAVKSAPPWRFCFACPEAEITVELPAGTIGRTGTEKGQRINLDWNLSSDTIAKWHSGVILKGEGVIYENTVHQRQPGG